MNFDGHLSRFPSRVPALWTFFGKLVHARLVRQIEYLKVENEILRAHIPKHHVVVTAKQRDLLLRFGESLGQDLRELIKIVTFKTFQRWVRERAGAALHPRPRRGRPPTAEDIRDLVLRLARENAWGYTRVLAELRKLGISAISRTTIRNILKAAGLPPSLERDRTGWDHFVQRHIDTLVACDFFSKEVWTPVGRRFAYFLVFLHVGTRKVFVSRSTFHPNTEWVTQQARNVLGALRDADQDVRILLRDRDTKFTRQFDEVFLSEGIQTKPLPIRSPNLNGFCEAWIGSLKRECLNHFTRFGQTHVDHVVHEYVRYYNTVRPHSALENRPLEDLPQGRDGPVRCDARLGGLLNHYYRDAA